MTWPLKANITALSALVSTKEVFSSGVLFRLHPGAEVQPRSRYAEVV